MNLYQKLVEIRKECLVLPKNNKGHQFEYVSSPQTISSVRRLMDEYGVLLVPEATGHTTTERPTERGKSFILTEIDMRYTWINAENPEERLPATWYGQGLDQGERGVGKAYTYSEKTFLLKFFNIPTEKDDPDAIQRANDKIVPRKTLWQKVGNDPDIAGYSEDDIKGYINARAEETGKDAKQLENLMADNYQMFKEKLFEWMEAKAKHVTDREPGEEG